MHFQTVAAATALGVWSSCISCGSVAELSSQSPIFVAQVPFTLFLHCPKEELKKRLLERGETSGRADDNVETVLKRFDTFENESMPVVEQLQRLGMVGPSVKTNHPPRVLQM